MLKTCKISKNSNYKNYSTIPQHLSLTNVVIIHRHGDRSQISPSIGMKYPPSTDMKNIWKTKFPIEKTMKKLHASASIPSTIPMIHEELDIMYAYGDEMKYPYGQLTEIGSESLQNIGR